MSKDIIFSFQGVHGAYSELAGKKLFPDSQSIPCKTFEEMFDVVRNNKATLALVPIENSNAGSGKIWLEDFIDAQVKK